MKLISSTEDLNIKLREVLETTARISGMRSEISASLFRITDEVSRAKAALLLKDETRTVLENFQALIHSRTVGSYERLLSGLVDDIIGDGSTVRLELSSDSGAASLDVVVEKSGNRFSIMDSEGGALTNVVSMGLRLIATLRSGARPFLLLDEADCWMETEKVPAFYGALADMSNNMGLQIIAVTHNPVDLLRDCNPRIFKISGQPLSPEGVKVSIINNGADHVPQSRGIKSINLKDFAGYGDITFDIAPGLNIITGSNNVGKSRINRALRAMCYGESSTGDIRIGKRSTSVTVTVDNGDTIEWSRDTSRNPVTLWKSTNIGGDITTAGGRVVPVWVDKTIGIARREGLDVQLGHQKNSVFLLNENGKQRAAVLSVGRESSILQEMMKLYRTDVMGFQTTVRNGEKEVSALMGRLGKLASLDDIKATIPTTDDIAALHRSLAVRLSIESMRSKINDIQRCLEIATQKSAALDIPAPPENNGKSEKTRMLMLRISKGKSFIAGLHEKKSALSLPDIPVIKDTRRLRETARSISEIHIAKNKASAKLAKMTVSPPPLLVGNKASVLLLSIRESMKNIGDSQLTLKKLSQEVAVAHDEWKLLTDNMPCPVCGGDMTGSMPETYEHA